jgi:hypothetical protein
MKYCCSTEVHLGFITDKGRKRKANISQPYLLLQAHFMSSLACGDAFKG